MVVVLSSYPYTILVMRSGLAGFCCGVLHSGTDLLCVLALLLFCAMFLHFNHFPYFSLSFHAISG